MSARIHSSYSDLIRKYKLPRVFSAARVSRDAFQTMAESFKDNGLLYLLQGGLGAAIFRSPSSFASAFAEIKDLVAAIDDSLEFFGFTHEEKRQIILDKVCGWGKRQEFARDLARIRTTFSVSGIAFMEADRADVLAAIKSSSRGHPFVHLFGRLLTRVSKIDPAKLPEIYDALGVSADRKELLARVHNLHQVPWVIGMQEERFQEKLRIYREGITISYTGPKGKRRSERFTFADKERMADVVLRNTEEVLCRRIAVLRARGVAVISADAIIEMTTAAKIDPALNLCRAARQAVLEGDLPKASDLFNNVLALQGSNVRGVKSAKKGLEIVGALEKAESAAKSGQLMKAVDLYAQAVEIVGSKGEAYPLHFHIMKKILAYVQDVHTDAVSAAIRQYVGLGEKGLVPAESNKRRIKHELVLAALDLLETACREEERTEFAVAVVLQCLFDKHFYFEKYSTMGKQAEDVVRILGESGRIPFDVSTIPPHYQRSLTVFRLSFYCCLFSAAGVQLTSGQLSNNFRIPLVLDHLADGLIARSGRPDQVKLGRNTSCLIRALRLEAENNLAAARLEVEQALSLDPQDEAAIRMRGRLILKTKVLEKQRVNAEASAYLQAGNAALSSPNIDRAVDHYEKVIGLDADNAGALIGLNKCLRLVTAEISRDKAGGRFQSALIGGRLAIRIAKILKADTAELEKEQTDLSRWIGRTDF